MYLLQLLHYNYAHSKTLQCQVMGTKRPVTNTFTTEYPYCLPLPHTQFMYIPQLIILDDGAVVTECSFHCQCVLKKKRPVN